MTSYILEHNVEVPMRDGVVLRMDIYRPADGEAHPVLLTRTPYGKAAPLTFEYFHLPQAMAAGYTVVYQDVRGRFESDGDFAPLMNEAHDGFDTIEWIARQDWCDGNVGMFGTSYWGATQILAAGEAPPSLKAIVPVFAPTEAYNHCYFQDGAFALGWVLLMGVYGYAADSVARLSGALREERPSSAGTFAGLPTKNSAANDAIARRRRALDKIGEAYSFMPMRDLPIMHEVPGSDYYFDWLANSSASEFWRPADGTSRLASTTCAGLHIGGWFDLVLKGTLTAYERMRGDATTTVQAAQRLLVGPWAHRSPYFASDYDGISFGAAGNLDKNEITALHLAYFDASLSNSDQEFSSSPVRIFVMGENVWRDELEWPLARTKYAPWFIHEGGHLTPVAPSQDDEPSIYDYDPRDPTPVVGIPSLPEPREQGSLKDRADTLSFESPSLDHPVEATGPLRVVLYVSTDAADTDFVARLIDVHPDGSAWQVAEGITRMRYRTSLSAPEPVTPGEIYEIEIDLIATSNVFLAGHRIRLDIASACFPRFDRNMNTGNELGTDRLEDAVTARQVIYHDVNHPSHVLLPIIPRQSWPRVSEQKGMWPTVSVGRDGW